jgi:hypothetical protein
LEQASLREVQQRVWQRHKHYHDASISMVR